MNNVKQRRVMVIGIDAAEPTFVRRLIEQNEMPALKSLLARGRWLRVVSPERIGSGSVWPTFISGHDPNVHGVYGEWLWNSKDMAPKRYCGNDIEPFWKSFVSEGISVGVLDVPFMPMIGLATGFEISEWGPHDVVEGRTQVAPEHVGAIIDRNSPHPLKARIQLTGPDDYQNLELLARSCLEGIKRRGETARLLLAETAPEFALVVFTEIHHSGHHLWHKVDSFHPLYSRNGFASLRETRPTIAEIFRELDRQIGGLTAAAGSNTSVVVFSLHGMRPAHGTPAFLADWFCEMGLARMADWKRQTWRERATSWFGRLKRNLPGPIKLFYYKIAPPKLTFKLAKPTMLPMYDWSQTRAFALPSDQHGWIRINLAGRESCGLVPKEEYEQMCDELEQSLRNLRSDTGESLVRSVIRTADSVEAAMNHPLPDVIAHWSDAVFATPLRIAGSQIKPEVIGRKYVGQHGLEGFCIAPAEATAGDDICAKDLHLMFRCLLAGTN